MITGGAPKRARSTPSVHLNVNTNNKSRNSNRNTNGNGNGNRKDTNVNSSGDDNADQTTTGRIIISSTLSRDRTATCANSNNGNIINLSNIIKQ